MIKLLKMYFTLMSALEQRHIVELHWLAQGKFRHRSPDPTRGISEPGSYLRNIGARILPEEYRSPDPTRGISEPRSYQRNIGARILPEEYRSPDPTRGIQSLLKTLIFFYIFATEYRRPMNNSNY